jgi:hypothetical protein
MRYCGANTSILLNDWNRLSDRTHYNKWHFYVRGKKYCFILRGLIKSVKKETLENIFNVWIFYGIDFSNGIVFYRYLLF